MDSRNVAIVLLVGLLIVGCVAVYQQVLLLTLARSGTTVTTTVTGASSRTIAISSFTTTIDNQAFASTTNYTLGLEITLTLNATHLVAGNPVNITLTVQNLLPRTLNLPTSAEDWRLTALAVSGDDYGYCMGAFPFDMEVFSGHFTESNITRGAPINVERIIFDGCHIPVVPYNTFGPLVIEHRLRDITNGYNINGQSFTFQPGPYTVVAGDRWGQIVILNFMVEQAKG